MAPNQDSRLDATDRKRAASNFAAFLLLLLTAPQANAFNCVQDCDITVSPHGTFAELTISTPEEVAGLSVIVSRDHPQPNGDIAKKISMAGVAGPTAQASIKVGNLTPDTVYYYQVVAIEEWPGPDPGMFDIWATRKFGVFRTLQRETWVEFREVHMIDDADDWGGGDGDFTFWFWVHNEKPVKKAFGDGVVGSGETHALNTTVAVTGLPDSINVVCQGRDDDSWDWPNVISKGQYPGNSPPSHGENVDGYHGFETAVGTASLSLGPSAPFNELITDEPFYLKAKEDWMEFEIHGQYSVQYNPAPSSEPLPEVTQPPVALRAWIYQPAEDDCTHPEWRPQKNYAYCTAVPLQVRSIEPETARLTIEWQKWHEKKWIPYCEGTGPLGLVSSEWLEQCNKFYRSHASGELDISAPRANFPVLGCQRLRATSVSKSTGIKGPPSEWRTFYVPRTQPSMVNVKNAPNPRLSAGLTVEFSWTSGCTNVDEWFLGVGKSKASLETAPYGDIYHAHIDPQELSTIVTNVPSAGSVYVRLWYRKADDWNYHDYRYSFSPTPSP